MGLPGSAPRCAAGPRPPYWAALAAAEAIQAELLRAARARYTSAGKLLVNTPGYLSLLKTVRQIEEQIKEDT